MLEQINFSKILMLILLTLLSLVSSEFAQAQNNNLKPTSLTSIRLWPAKVYTRLTIESIEPIKYKSILLNNPDRLVLDFENLDFDDLHKKIKDIISHDKGPLIDKFRLSRFDQNTIRLVIDLKKKIEPEIFSLDPIENYKNRLVFDLYSFPRFDPINALIDNQIKKEKPTKLDQDSDAKSPKTNKVIKNSTIVIMLDAGHGGEDPGAIGKKGTKEKNITLKIAKKLATMINREKNLKALLTRSNDYFIPLGTRVNKARQEKADLFISIHADAFKNRKVKGSSVFVLSNKGASSKAAQILANKENSADLIGGININQDNPLLAKTLLDLSQTATLNHSNKFANHILNEISKVNKLHTGYVERASFAVLKAPDIPSILIETAFISNPEEEKKLLNNKYQNQIARAIFKGIKSYLKQNPIQKLTIMK